MTDPDLTPEQEAVRRLLADARHDGPTPPEVVSRLDDALASLVAERHDAPVSPADDRPAQVVDLGARRRRIAAMGVLAAAAVVVAGVGLGQVLPHGSSDSDSSGSSASSADDSSSRELGAQSEESSEDAAGGDSSSQLAPQPTRKAAPFSSAPTFTSTDADLDQQLLAVRSQASQRSEGRSQDLDSAEALSCELPPLGPGRRLLAEVDDQPGVVVYRRPDGDAQQVAVYVCGLPDAVRTLTLPAP